MADDKLFFAAEPNLLICLDSRNGKLLWREEHPRAGEETNRNKNTRNTAATPVTNGQVVGMVFGNGLVVCRTAAGRLKWRQQLSKTDLKRGQASSPVIAESKLIVQTNELVAFDIESGGIAWRIENIKPGYATPNVVKIGADVVLIHRDGHIIRAKDGKILASQLWNEFQKMNSTIVHDGVLYVHNQLDVMALRLPMQVSEPLQLEELWRRRMPQGGYPIPSPLYHEGLLYTAKEDGILTCLEANTGETVFKTRMGISNRLHPSPFYANGHIYYGNHRGETVVIKPGKRYREVRLNQLQPTGSSPVCRRNSLFIRTNQGVYCLRSEN